MSIQRYQPTNTTLHDIYQLYNPFAYPYEYTDKMINKLSTMIDRSVARTLDNYFNEKAFDLKVVDKGNFYEASADIEGIDPDDVKVSFADGLLTITGEKKVDSVSPDGTTRTSRYEYVAKTVSVPDTNKAVMAKALNGRLTVTIPK